MDLRSFIFSFKGGKGYRQSDSVQFLFQSIYLLVCLLGVCLFPLNLSGSLTLLKYVFQVGRVESAGQGFVVEVASGKGGRY